MICKNCECYRVISNKPPNQNKPLEVVCHNMHLSEEPSVNPKQYNNFFRPRSDTFSCQTHLHHRLNCLMTERLILQKRIALQMAVVKLDHGGIAENKKRLRVTYDRIGWCIQGIRIGKNLRTKEVADAVWERKFGNMIEE